MTTLVHYYQGFVFVHFQEFIQQGSVCIYTTTTPVNCTCARNLKATNFIRIPFPYDPGRYQVVIRYDQTELIKYLLVT